MRRITRVAFRLGFLAAAAVAAASLALARAPRGRAAHATPPVVRVLVVGGSAARGWHARGHRGYLDQALSRYGRRAHVRFQVINQAIPGAGVESPRVARHYRQWVDRVSPGWVVLAWGTLNDLRTGTPLSVVRHVVAHEARVALAAGNVVLLVTPMPTEASYTRFRLQQPRVVAAEQSAARSVGSTRVVVLDLFSAMRRYLAAHALPYRLLMHDHWDPGDLGHRIAGRILATLLWRRFGPHPPVPGLQRR